MPHDALLGPPPDHFSSCTAETRRVYLRDIFAEIAEGVPFDAACWASGVDPDELRALMTSDEHVRRGVMRQFGRLEAKLVRETLAGGPGVSTAKAALEVLSRTRKGWAPKSSIEIGQELAEGLQLLRAQLPAGMIFDGAAAYEIVVRTLAKAS
jgi:hypothetical protein